MTYQEPDRLFKIWDYTVSHKTLLIRSDTDVNLNPAPRIEIYAGHVDAMFVRSMMYGLTVHRATTQEASDISDRHQIEADASDTYILESRSGNGFIISGPPSWRKAVREIEAPTLFNFSQPWPPGDDVSWGDVE